MPCESPCDACKPGDLPILFTRYAAAFSAEPEHAAALKKLKPSGQFKAPSVSLKTAGYSVRLLREGVLYVLTERAGAKVWRGFMVHAHGYLSEFNPLLTPSPAGPAAPACEVAMRGANKSLVWIADPKSVSNLWYFFHPDTVLPDVLRNLKADPAKLHKLDVAAWVGGCPPTPHTCMPDALGTQVGEWAALVDSVMLDALNEQIYGVMGLDTAQQGYGQGQIPVYANAALNKTTTNPPPKDIFSADNPWGSWTRTDRLGLGTLPAYAKVHGARLENIAKALAGEPGNPNKPPGIVAACDDAIGIAQETNHWRNKPYRDLIIWGDGADATPDKSNRQSRKTRFEVGNTLVMMADSFKQSRIAIASRYLEAGAAASENPVILEELLPEKAAGQRANPRAFATRAEYDAYRRRLEGAGKTTASNAANAAQAKWSEYMSQLDLDTINTWRTTYVSKAQDCEKEAERRASDSLAWINSTALQDTLALYNGDGRNDLAQGAKCAAQLNGIVEGMGGGGTACEDKIMAWAADHADNPKNLLWRAYLMNQEDAQGSFQAAMEKAKAPTTTAAEHVEQFKVQIDKFAKFNDLVEGRNNASIKLSSAIPLFGFSPVLNLIGHAVLKAGSGKLGPENALARALMVSLVAGAGSPAAVELHARQRWNLSQITPERFRASPYFKWGQENLKLESQQAINKIMAEGKAGEFFKMRLTGVMTLLEGILLTFKARQLGGASDVDAAQRAAWELGAAAMTTTAAALEMGAMTQEWLAGKVAGTSRATTAMAEIRLGGFKLAGNALAGVAGIVSAVLDVTDAGKAYNEKKYSLMCAFAARGISNGLTFFSSMAMGFSYAEPLLKLWAERAGTRTVGGRVLGGLAARAASLALRRAAIFSTTLWLALAVAAATWVIGKLSDDEMQRWCKRSGFRKPGKPEEKPEPLYDKPGEELVALYGAFKAITE